MAVLNGCSSWLFLMAVLNGCSYWLFLMAVLNASFEAEYARFSIPKGFL